MRTFALRGALLALLFVAPAALQAQGTIRVDFSGGNGGFMYATLRDDVTIQLQEAFTDLAFGLAFPNAYSSTGASFPGTGRAADGITAQGPGIPLTDISGFTFCMPVAPFTGHDLTFFFGTGSHNFSVGDTIVIHAGTAITSSQVPELPPDAPSPYSAVLVDNSGHIRAASISVPEPTVTALAGLAFFCCLVLTRTHRRQEGH